MKQKPYHLLLWTAALLLIASFFTLTAQHSVDIHLHDTYYVIANTHVFRLLALAALLVWLLYVLTNTLLYAATFSWIHVGITILTLVLLAGSLFVDDQLQLTQRHYYNFSDFDSFAYNSTLVNTITISVVVLLFGQVVYVINLVAGVVKRLVKRRD